MTQNEVRRAETLESWGFAAYDALHIACAESAAADVCLTTDDDLLRRARARSHDLRVRVRNPLVGRGGVEEVSVMQMSLEEIRVAGLRAVSRDLGAVGLVRFLQQFETGHGDYSVERHEWLSTDTVHGVAERIRQMRAAREGQAPQHRAANQQALGESAR